MGCDKLIKEIAPVKAPYSLIMLILNIILPGFGTALNSCMGEKFNVTTFIVAIL